MDVKFAFSKEDYAAIAAELYALMVKQAVPAGFQPATAPAPAPVAPAPSPYPAIQPALIPAPAPVVAPAPLAAVPGVTQPAPVQTLDAVTFQTQDQVTGKTTGDERGLSRIDDVVPEGTPGTIKMLKTGNVLSIPQPGSESWGGYLGRVYRQTKHFAPVYAMAYGDSAFEGFGGFKADGSNWPICADRCYNPDAYRSDDAKARERAYNESIGWDGVPGHANDPWIAKAAEAPKPTLQTGTIIERAVRRKQEEAAAAPAPAPETVFIQS